MPLIPFVKNGFFGSKAWLPLVKGNGLTAGGGDPVPEIVWVKVSGTSPLSLPDAIANYIKSLTQYGLCTQASTPTPDAPVDIVCNNGAIKYGALGANLLDPSAANTVLGYYINRSDGEIKASPYNFMFAGYMPVEGGKTYVAYGREKNGNDLSDYNRVAWYDSTQTWIEGASYTQNKIAIVTAPANAAYARFSCNPSGGTSDAVTQAIVDSYNWMFAEGTAEITPFVPFVGGIYTDGTPEVLTVSGKNIFDKSNLTRIYAYIQATGTTWWGVSTGYSVRIPCQPNTTYTARYNGNSTQAVLSFGSTDNDDVPVDTSYVTITQAIRQNSPTIDTPITITTSATDKWLIVAYNVADPQNTDMANNLQIEIGATATAYEPYVAPQTVNDVPMLLSVDDYKDEVEIISGIKTGKVGVMIIDGTEDWTNYSGGNGVFYLDSDATFVLPSNCLCTHYKGIASTMGASNMPDNSIKCGYGSDERYKHRVYLRCTAGASLEDLKTFLAAQYAAGTPVIVLYRLATETTEQGTPHALHTTEGTNTIDVTANVSPISLECEYADGYEETE